MRRSTIGRLSSRNETVVEIRVPILSSAAILAGFLLAGCSGGEANRASGAGGNLGMGGTSAQPSIGGSSSGGTSTQASTTAVAATGGLSPSGTTGGKNSGTGGSNSPSGGVGATGGAAPIGGIPATGGATTAAGGNGPSSGGKWASGGTSSGAGSNTMGTGGKSTNGGASATGGKSINGGATGAGGTTSAGGASFAGGTTSTGTSSPSEGYPENPGANCAVTAGSLKKNSKLPDPFAMHDGTRITNKAQWECRRNEIRKDLEKYEIGTKQEPPTVAASLSGTSLSVKVTTSAGSVTLTSTITTVSGTGNCAVIGMNGKSSLVSTCVQIPFMHDQVVTYSSGSTQTQSDPFYKVYPSLWGKIGNYSAWSWGISRLIDGLDQVKDQLGIDMSKIAVHGCSYAGKMALFGGALDARVALTVAQESGGGGIDAWRASADFAKRTGTSIEKIDNTNYSWFLSSMRSLDPYSLPHDHHELIAMVAPRAIIILGNGDYDWLGDESGYKSTMAAVEVFKALGVADRIGYDFTSGHTHCQAATSQVTSVNAFVNKFLKGQTASTNIAIKPTKSGFDLDYSTLIDWTTPTLQ